MKNKDTMPSQAKPSQAKPSQAKPSQAKPSQAKPSLNPEFIEGQAVTDKPPVLSEQTINQRNLAVLQQYFPQALEVDAHGRFIINSTKLQLALDPAGVKVEEDGYEMRWVGKREAYHTAFLPTQKILNPLTEDSKNWDSTNNLLLRGDNLEALRLLRHSYFGKIKLIYIDPPYNTKSEAFIYKDDFSSKQTQILEELGYDADNIDYIKNIYGAKTHSGWLSFMYPRLLLAKDLLRDDGVIFISIDDNEQAQLKLLCDEIFGEENFVSNIIWQRAFSPKNDAKYLSVSHDNLLMYTKNIENFVCGRLKRTDDINARYTNQDNDTRGFWTSSDLTVKTYSEKYDYPITTPSGRKISPTEGRCWSMPKNKIKELINDNRIWFGVDGDNIPRLKRFLSEVQDGITPTTLWLHQEVGHNQEGRQEVKALFDNKGLFDGVKPVRLLSKILRVANLDLDDIILDFFAGSGTTAEAVMRLNAEDGGNRSFILVQIPQAIDPQKQKEAHRFVTEDLNKPATIFEITAERLRRAGQKIDAEHAVDTGFRVFDIIDDSDALILQKPLAEVTQADLNIFIQHNTETDNRERVLYNLLLAEGLPLSTVIHERLPDTLYQADDVLFMLAAIEMVTLTDTLNQLKQSTTPAVYLTVYAPWVRDDNFMQGIKTLAESLGFSNDKLRLRG